MSHSPLSDRHCRGEPVQSLGVREDPLRATVGLRGLLNLTSWRGRSGRRYVAGVHRLADRELLELEDAVLIAVQRDADGSACVVDAAAVDPSMSGARCQSWIARLGQQGVTEIHVHRLAEEPEARQAIVDDLRPIRRLPISPV